MCQIRTRRSFLREGGGNCLKYLKKSGIKKRGGTIKKEGVQAGSRGGYRYVYMYIYIYIYIYIYTYIYQGLI